VTGIDTSVKKFPREFKRKKPNAAVGVQLAGLILRDDHAVIERVVEAATAS
jgi:hypothetical protein